MAISSEGWCKKYSNKTVSAAPLAVFRIVFGLMIVISTIRFWAKGWIAELYIKPFYFFSYYGFEWVQPIGNYTYVLFAICALSAFFVAIGYYYRIAAITLFLSFTYIELMDKTTYLNHYYFVSVISFLFIFLPAHAYFSADAYRTKKTFLLIPAWCVDVLKLMVGILYVYAGLAKLNTDWLVQAQPLRIWLPAHNDIPVIGFLFNKVWVAYFFSWASCAYDLSIPFLLLVKRTRLVGYALVIIFHGLTAMLFPIGMFPYVMMVTGLLFFSAHFHQQLINTLCKWFNISQKTIQEQETVYSFPKRGKQFIVAIFVLFFTVQLLFPWRYLLYNGNLFWTEEGYRFSWRVMLMEKAGYAQFTVTDTNGKKQQIRNSDFLTPLQEKMMSTQPDMMVQYAQLLKQYFIYKGYESPKVFADVYVSLNGRLSAPFINPTTDLAAQNESFYKKKWILNP